MMKLLSNQLPMLATALLLTTTGCDAAKSPPKPTASLVPPTLTKQAIEERTMTEPINPHFATQVMPAMTPEQLKAKPAARYDLMMVQWMSPLMWKSYPTQWNLLFHLDLAKRNAVDDYNDPAGTPVGSITEARLPWLNLHQLIDGVIDPVNHQMIDNREYFYTVIHDSPSPRWFDQQVMLAVPQAFLDSDLDGRFWRNVGDVNFNDDVARDAWAEEQLKKHPKLTKAEVGLLASMDIWGTGEGRNPRFNPTNSAPAVTVDAGERGTGFVSLARAVRYLETTPTKPVWVMGMDAPDYEYAYKNQSKLKAGLPSENAVWLVLTQPGFKHPYPRKPVASIYTPVRIQLADKDAAGNEIKDSKRTRAAALKAAIAQAATAAGIAPKDFGMFFHDAGQTGAATAAATGTVSSSAAIGALGQALTELAAVEGDQFLARTADVDKYTKNARAAAATLNIAFAAAYGDRTGKPAMVVGTRDEGEVYAVVITPPAGHTVRQPPITDWPRAGKLIYNPWWGERIKQ